MKRSCQLALGFCLLVSLAGRTVGNAPATAPTAEQRDPDETFRKVCEQLVALEPKYVLLKGVFEAKRVVKRDEKDQLKSADFVFERNAVPPEKSGAGPKDESKPFVYIDVHIWSGQSLQPSPGHFRFEWRGREYFMSVGAWSSDDDLVKAAHAAIDRYMRVPVSP
jgi:hypothetical protein